jgi:ring-1,2-phenylacetyl-CoA epoxidase subunit PaaE
MTPSFHRLTIREKRRETADSVSLAFEVPAELRPAYRFKQGQFLVLRAPIEGEEQRRSYSICVGLAEYERNGELRVGIKRVAGGRFSNWANENLNPGESVDVMTPDGRFFTPLDEDNAKHYVGFAGGSGITPMLSLIKTTLATEPRSRFTLIYGNRTVGTIMFVEELEDLKNRYLERLRLYHVLSDEPQEIALFSGLLDQAKCQAFLNGLVAASSIDEAFVCGPEPMMAAAEQSLLAAGVAPDRIHIERFGIPMPAGGPARPIATVNAGADLGPVADVSIIVDGKERRLKLARDDVGILDAGLAAGIDLPYACKGGVCCSCRAKVLEGAVKMDKNYTLEDWEIGQGFVLTCQSHPLTERVVVSYDER